MGGKEVNFSNSGPALCGGRWKLKGRNIVDETSEHEIEPP
jgi:hypothetical protein